MKQHVAAMRHIDHRVGVRPTVLQLGSDEIKYWDMGDMGDMGGQIHHHQRERHRGLGAHGKIQCIFGKGPEYAMGELRNSYNPSIIQCHGAPEAVIICLLTTEYSGNYGHTR